MSYSIGDGMVALALAGGIVGYIHLKHRSRQQRMEIIHQERLAAMDKGIPLPELPLDAEARRGPEPPVIPILGVVLATLSLGAMVVLYMGLPVEAHRFWIAPLPLAFLGAGFMALHFLRGTLSR